jgi:hypothetical protein
MAGTTSSRNRRIYEDRLIEPPNRIVIIRGISLGRAGTGGIGAGK